MKLCIYEKEAEKATLIHFRALFSFGLLFPCFFFFPLPLTEEPGGAEATHCGVPAEGGQRPGGAAQPARDAARRPGADGGSPLRQPGAPGPGEGPDCQRAAAGG